MFWDGSSVSLKNTLMILEKIYKMSGLKINIEKTMLWIDALSRSEKNRISGIYR